MDLWELSLLLAGQKHWKLMIGMRSCKKQFCRLSLQSVELDAVFK
jgi:hypothetical protein